MSYPAAAGLLEELFPTGRRIHRGEICRTVEHIAGKLDDELDPDEFDYMNRRAIDRTTVPDLPMTATLDGGYVHSSEQRSRTADDDISADQECCDAMVADTREQIGRAKWFLWHGNHRRALQVLDDATNTL